jgi:hypothetical protein
MFNEVTTAASEFFLGFVSWSAFPLSGVPGRPLFSLGWRPFYHGFQPCRYFFSVLISAFILASRRAIICSTSIVWRYNGPMQFLV